MKTINVACHNLVCPLRGVLHLASALSLTRPLRIIPPPPFCLFHPVSFSVFCLFPEVFQHGVWKEVGSLKHPDLICLADRMKSTALMSRASGIVKGYTRQSVQQVEGVCLALGRSCNFSSGTASSGPLFAAPITIY